MKETSDKHFIGKIFSNASTKINILRLTNSYVMLAISAHQIQRTNSRYLQKVSGTFDCLSYVYLPNLFVWVYWCKTITLNQMTFHHCCIRSFDYFFCRVIIKDVFSQFFHILSFSRQIYVNIILRLFKICTREMKT